MKTKKIKFDWRSMLLGAVLCLVLVVFVASTAQGNQIEAQTRGINKGNQSEARPSVMQKMVTLNEVMAKCELIDQRILILEGKINHLQERVEYVLEILGNMSRKKN